MRISDWSSDVCSSDLVDRGEHPVHLDEALTKLAQVVVGQPLADHLGEGAQDGPVLARLARRKSGQTGQLDAALGVHVGGVLLGVGGARQNDVGTVRAGIAVMALIADAGADRTGQRLNCSYT